MSSFLFIVEVSFDHSWDIDVDVHDVSNKHLDHSFFVGIIVRGECGHHLGVIISSTIFIALLNLLLFGSEGLIIPSLLYVSELLQVDLRLFLD